MITSEQIELVQSSFAQVLPIADVAGELLYGRIFVLAPETRALFDDDIRPQVKRLMAAVKFAVDGLDRLEEVAPFLVKLGARHVSYGVRPEHFDLGGEALLWTLEQGLGDAFTPDIREAWTAAWNVVAGAMVAGMRDPEGHDHRADGDQLPTGRADAAPSSIVSATRL
jgi:hemoglobin-like flavoprotein